jgi:ribonucleotide reductase beta subunit family protein with ferritin-like domain
MSDSPQLLQPLLQPSQPLPPSPTSPTQTDIMDYTITPFQEDNLAQRYVLFPIKHPKIWESYKRQQNAYWTAESVDLSEDLKAFENLTPGEQHFIKMVLAFFAASDGIVLENLALRFMKDVQLPEARCAYGFQLAMENIHSEMYSLLIDVLIQDEVEKNRVFNAINDSNFPAIKQKADWARKWIASDQQFGQRLVAFAVVEGVFFSGSFCAIFWLKKRQILMPGLFESNAYISRDEGMHTDHAVLLYNMIEKHHKLNTTVIHQLVSEAVEIEEKFITEALPVDLIGMNCGAMSQYIRYVADRLLKQLGYATLYNVSNPFEWMLTIGLAGKTNFFEGRVPDYNSAHILKSSTNTSTNTYAAIDDF